MFAIDSSINDLKIREKSLLKVFFSMNVHHAAAPDMSLEEARSYVFFFNEGRETISSYIGLHFLHSDRRLFYTCSKNPFAYGELTEVETEARNFAEDLGAMLDEIDFAKMSDLEKGRWIDEQEIFSGRKKSADSPEIPGADSAAGQTESGLESGQAENIASPGLSMPVQSAMTDPAAENGAVAAARPSRPVMPEGEQKQSVPEAHAPAARAQAPSRPAPFVQQDPAAQAPATKSRPQRKPAAAQAGPGRSASAARPEQTDDVLAQAVKDGIVKAPRQQLRKDLRGGALSRDKEALARLLSSF